MPPYCITMSDQKTNDVVVCNVEVEKQSAIQLMRNCIDTNDWMSLPFAMQSCNEIQFVGGWDGDEKIELQRLVAKMRENAPLKDKRYMLQAVSRYGRMLYYASSELRSDKTVVLAAVSTFGTALKFAHPRLRADKEVVLAAVRQDGMAIEFSSDELKADPLVISECNWERIKSVLQYADESAKDDYDHVMNVIKNDGRELQYVSKRLQKNHQVVFAAVAQNGAALEFASKELQDNRNIVLKAVESHGLSLRYAGEELRSDREVVLLAVSNDSNALAWASRSLRTDSEIALAAIYTKGSGMFKAVGMTCGGPRCHI